MSGKNWLASPRVLAMGVVALVAVIFIIFVQSEHEYVVGGLLALVVIGVLVANRLGLAGMVRDGFIQHEKALQLTVVLALLAVAGWFYEDHFPILMLTTALLYAIAALGLNIQFGYAGIVNFAGAAFFGIGCYTAAVLSPELGVPRILTLPLGGAVAALVGSVLILPILRTRGHYAALVTIAFGILFKTFLEVNDFLGGPQGLNLAGMNLFGWDFNTGISLGEDTELSFYFNYFLLALALLVLAFAFVQRLERSWIGLSMDVVRVDETAAACFGMNIARWKVMAFMLGNFMIGTAGALYGQMLGFIAPANFEFADSLILVSIVILGGLGNPWGALVAAIVVIILPEKFQILQEYRFLLYATMVIMILLFKPSGLLPRPARRFFPGRSLP